MQNNSLIKSKILQFIKSNNISKYSFYQKTNITRGVLDKDGGISEDNLAKFIAHYPNVNLEWLILDKGEMLKLTTSINYDLDNIISPTLNIKSDIDSTIYNEIEFLREQVQFYKQTNDFYNSKDLIKNIQDRLIKIEEFIEMVKLKFKLELDIENIESNLNNKSIERKKN